MLGILKIYNDNKAISLIVGIFLAIYLIFGAMHKIGDYGVETDFYGSYAIESFHLMHGQMYMEPDHGPGYSFVLIPFYWLLGDMFEAGKTVSILSAIFFGLFTYGLFKRLFDKKVAFFTTLFLYIILIPFAYKASNDIFFAFLFMAGLYYLLKEQKFSTKNILFAAIFSGYAVMTRINGFVLPLGAVIFFVVDKLFFNKDNKFVWILVYIIVVLVISSPWFVFNYLRTGHIFRTTAYQTIAASIEGNPDKEGWAEAKIKAESNNQSLTTVLLANPVHTVKLIAKNSIEYFEHLIRLVTPFPLYLIFLPGLIFMLISTNYRTISILIFPFLGFEVYVITAFFERLFFYVTPFIIIAPVFYLVGSHVFLKDIHLRKKLLFLNTTVLCGAILLIFPLQLKKAYTAVQHDPAELIKISQVLKENSAIGERIIARKPHLAFISGLKMEYFPQVKNVDELQKYMRQKNVDLLFYGSIERELRPDLQILQNPLKLPQNFHLIYFSKKDSSFLYKVNLNEYQNKELNK